MNVKRLCRRGWFLLLVAMFCLPLSAEQPSVRYTGEYDRLARQIAKCNPDSKAYKRLQKESLRNEALILPTDRDPLDVVLRRSRALLNHLKTMNNAPKLVDLDAALQKLETANKSVTEKTLSKEQLKTRREQFMIACKLRRKIAMKNPLLNFDKLLFLTHPKQAAGERHMCDQYFGFNAGVGGGLYVLDNPFGDKPVARNLLTDAKVQNGRLKGKTLQGGSFISLELSYDAKTIYFAWTQAKRTRYKWAPDSTYHIFKCNADGTGLTQLTDGPFNEFDPCELPNGRIVFISERGCGGSQVRCLGFGRCHGRAVPTFTLHSMKPDGSDIITLSYHETNEWHPSVTNSGMITYTRWDYVDRDSDVAHHLWLCYPDGRDPRSYHGNYPVVREKRPWMELAIRAIPGSHKFIATSAPHHGENYGSLILIDQRIRDDNEMSQVKRVTPEVLLPESEKAPGVPGKTHGGRHRPRAEVYGTAWPLDEDFYLAVYDPAQKHYGVYLVDSFGNKIFLYRAAKIPALDPIPLRPRKRPPVIPTQTRHAAEDRNDQPPAKTGVMAVMNVYDSDFQWPKDAKITGLRIVQLFPKTTTHADKPRIGMARQSLARGVLGTVPVEKDGSAYFEAPVGVPLYFQALDEHGRAVQSMRSATYLHPGETLSCQGCHEDKHRPVSPSRKRPLALKRPPSKIRPDVSGSFPLLYPKLVQPVLDKKCVSCHAKKKKTPALDGNLSKKAKKTGWSNSFQALAPRGYYKSGGNGSIRPNRGSRSIAGEVGAYGSKLYPFLAKGHKKVKLTAEEMYRITLWLDCNTNFYGDYHNTKQQAQGKPVTPKPCGPPQPKQ